MLINLLGQQEDLTCLKPDDKNHALLSCSVTWQNQFYIFGGKMGEIRQISLLTGYNMERIGSLSFDFRGGTCSAMNNKLLFLCFDSADYQRCRRSNGPSENFSEVAKSIDNHRSIQTSCSKSKSLSICNKEQISPSNKLSHKLFSCTGCSRIKQWIRWH